MSPKHKVKPSGGGEVAAGAAGATDAFYATRLRTFVAILASSLVGLLGAAAIIALIGSESKSLDELSADDWGVAVSLFGDIGQRASRDAWGMLGVLATALVAVALAGRGAFSEGDKRNAERVLSTGLRRGERDGKPPISFVSATGLFCGFYLVICAILIMVHIVRSAAEGDGGAALVSSILPLPVMVGGIFIAAHAGVFVKNVDDYVDSARRRVKDIECRCVELGWKKGEPVEMTSRARLGYALGLISGMSAAPLVAVVMVTSVLYPSASALLPCLIFALSTIGLSVLVVTARWFVDSEDVWSGRLLGCFVAVVVIVLHFAWIIFVVTCMELGELAVKFGIGVATIFYGVALAVGLVGYVVTVKSERQSNHWIVRLSPIAGMDRVILSDRVERLNRARGELEEMEEPLDGQGGGG